MPQHNAAEDRLESSPLQRLLPQPHLSPQTHKAAQPVALEDAPLPQHNAAEDRLESSPLQRSTSEQHGMPAPQQKQQPKGIEAMIECMRETRPAKRDATVTILKRPASCASPKPVAPPVKATKGKKKLATNKKPAIQIQYSVSNVLARTGLETYPRSKQFPFTDTQASLQKAQKDAKAWLRKMGV